MIEKLRGVDFNTLNESGVEELVNELTSLPDDKLKESLEVLLDEKVEIDSDVPMSLQLLFNNEKISAMLVQIENDTNNQ